MSSEGAVQLSFLKLLFCSIFQWNWPLKCVRKQMGGRVHCIVGYAIALLEIVAYIKQNALTNMFNSGSGI